MFPGDGPCVGPVHVVPNTAFGHALFDVFKTGACNFPPEGISCKTHKLTLIERMQGPIAARKQSVVSDTGNSNSHFICATHLRVRVSRIESKNLHVFLTPDTCTKVLLRRSPSQLVYLLGR